MTYQVSYCIYTAATVESEELKRASTQQEREDAATRLAAAFQILQKEASHTPGSGRSLDTIRRLLSTGPPRAANVGPHPGHDQVSAFGQQSHAHQANPYQLTSLDSRSIANRSEQMVLGDGQRSLTSTSQPASYENGNSNSGNSHPRMAAAINPPMYENSFLPMDVAAWDEDFSLVGTDTGAGFHPDAFPWGVAGPALRNSGSSSFPNNGVAWHPLTQSEGLP